MQNVTSLPTPVTRNQSTSTRAKSPVGERLFYSTASAALLVLVVTGFRFFYFHGQAFPGRELTPPIRVLVIIHGLLMSAWMLLAVAQPLLVASGNRKAHMMLGRVGALLAAAIFVIGLRVAIQATRVNPPDLKLFGLLPKEFLVVPFFAIILFAVFVALGVWNRRRPEVHRPLMFMASLAVISAALGRMPRLNDWYAGTWLEYWFSAFLTTIVLGAVLLVVKCVISKSFDRWFAAAFGAMTIVFVAVSLLARTGAWLRFASMLVG